MGDYCGVEAFFPIEKAGDDAEYRVSGEDIYYEKAFYFDFAEFTTIFFALAAAKRPSGLNFFLLASL